MQTYLSKSKIELRDGLLTWRSFGIWKRSIPVKVIAEVKRAERSTWLKPLIGVLLGLAIQWFAFSQVRESAPKYVLIFSGALVFAFARNSATKAFGIWIRHSEGDSWIWSRDNPVQLDSFLYLLDGEVKRSQNEK